MSLVLTVRRVTALPDPVAPSALYIVKSPTAGFVDLYFTNTDGTETRRLLNRDDILTLIQDTAITSVDWNIIHNGPMSSPTDIDQAVLDAHYHGNKPILDNLAEEAADGNLMYRGQYLRPPLELCEW